MMNVRIERKRSTRSTLLIWLRKIHLYLGLWGALLGLLFGVTGIILNHRVVMNIAVARAIQHSVEAQIAIDQFSSPEELSTWVQSNYNLTFKQPPFITIEPERQVTWAEKVVTQPEKWTVSFHKPDQAVTAIHYKGSNLLKLDIADSTFWGTITRLHMSVGVNAIWVLVADSIAGSFILLSISGLLLWTQFHKVKLTGVIVSISALVIALIVSLAM